ncbi:hypothetical protein HOY80DRAFT_1068582, partial [Tuber brumale]
TAILCWPALQPSGQEAYSKSNELGIVFLHPIKDVWEGNLSRKVIEHLNSNKVTWTSIDIVGIHYEDNTFCQVIFWICAQPEYRPFENGTKVACSFKEILVQYGIADVDVEIYESIVCDGHVIPIGSGYDRD